MFNQTFDSEIIASPELNPQQILERFDNLINSLCHENNKVSDLLVNLKPLIPYTKHFENLMDKIVENSCYNYHNQNYDNIDELLNKALRQFTFAEQLSLIANMHAYGMTHTEKTARLLKYFMRKIIKQRLLNETHYIKL